MTNPLINLIQTADNLITLAAIVFIVIAFLLAAFETLRGR
jgi:hypothetical protein